MKEYGLSHKDVIIPLSQAEMARLEYARMVLGEQEQAAFDESQAARKRPASDETSSSGSDGNNGADDPKQPSSKRRFFYRRIFSPLTFVKKAGASLRPVIRVLRLEERNGPRSET